jgi:hypothetical protein|tara:strand:+ start:534 stop:872 length:339 start_codon:yes stop_codon:yes gene_type:complete
MIVTDGFEIARDATAAIIDTGDVGTGTTAPQLSDTALQNAQAHNKAMTTVVKDSDEFDNYFTLDAGESASTALSEIGFFDSTKLFSRHTFAAITKGGSVTWRVVMNVQISEV